MEMVKRVKELFFTRESKEVLEIKRDMNNIKVTDLALDSYRNFVRGNKDLDNETLTNKLKRNYLVGNVTSRKEHYIRKTYGNMIMHCYTVGDEVIIKSLYNRRGTARDYKINKELKEKIDNIYNL